MKLFENKLLEELIAQCLHEGIDVTITDYCSETGDLGVWFDVGTQAKSSLFLREEKGKVMCYGRYGYKEEILSWDCLCEEVYKCMYGRDFINYEWRKVLEEKGILL